MRVRSSLTGAFLTSGARTERVPHSGHACVSPLSHEILQSGQTCHAVPESPSDARS